MSKNNDQKLLLVQMDNIQSLLGDKFKCFTNSFLKNSNINKKEKRQKSNQNIPKIEIDKINQVFISPKHKSNPRGHHTLSPITDNSQSNTIQSSKINSIKKEKSQNKENPPASNKNDNKMKSFIGDNKLEDSVKFYAINNLDNEQKKYGRKFIINKSDIRLQNSKENPLTIKQKESQAEQLIKNTSSKKDLTVNKQTEKYSNIMNKLEEFDNELKQLDSDIILNNIDIDHKLITTPKTQKNNHFKKDNKNSQDNNESKNFLHLDSNFLQKPQNQLPMTKNIMQSLSPRKVNPSLNPINVFIGNNVKKNQESKTNLMGQEVLKEDVRSYRMMLEESYKNQNEQIKNNPKMREQEILDRLESEKRDKINILKRANSNKKKGDDGVENQNNTKEDLNWNFTSQRF